MSNFEKAQDVLTTMAAKAMITGGNAIAGFSTPKSAGQALKSAVVSKRLNRLLTVMCAVLVTSMVMAIPAFALASFLLLVEIFGEVSSYRGDVTMTHVAGGIAFKVITVNIIFTNAQRIAGGLFQIFSTPMGENGIVEALRNLCGLGGSGGAGGSPSSGTYSVLGAIEHTIYYLAPTSEKLFEYQHLIGDAVNTAIGTNDRTPDEAAEAIRQSTSGFLGVNNMFAVAACFSMAMMSITLMVNVIFHIVGIVIEVAIYNVIAPLPLACLVSGHTRLIGISFIKSYGIAVLQLAMIAVVVGVCSAIGDELTGFVGTAVMSIESSGVDDFTKFFFILFAPLSCIITIYLMSATMKRLEQIVRQAFG
ncbi:MAG: hypothetical protein FWG90_02005 [Oscillospiraceae bacterium]|nr:hypothetical protein [Oscillospiraceae bacterium]